MITQEYLLKKLAQKKMKRRHMHKTRYGRELGEQWGYDMRGHMEECRRLSTDQIIHNYMTNQ